MTDNKLVSNFIKVLEDLNMKTTADTFRKEYSGTYIFNLAVSEKFTQKENTMLTQIYNYLNKKEKPENNKKTEKHKVALMDKDESEKIMERLIEKVAKKITNENETFNETTMMNSGLMKTKTFQNLMNKETSISPLASVKFF